MIPVGQALIQLPHLQHMVFNNIGSTVAGGRITLSGGGFSIFGIATPAINPILVIRKYRLPEPN